ncbi:Ima1 N-terminal domain-containing protein [Lactarius psammicola]|nr:Ima1 N-terminal domain-containing protein [Lactarius psammicola]
MSALLLRHPRTLCFFCQSVISPPPPQPLSFLCPHCGCWNRYDANGDILSDDPAMHDEALNRKSFARRASPRKDRLLTTFGSAPFCSTCQSNQRLIVSLLSSYLPPSDDDPDYEPRLASFESYKASMHARYPPVCERCAPLVEEEIRKKDIMARSNALGSWLNESKKKDTRRQVLSSSVDRYKLNRELRWWTARGVLWVATLVGVVSVDVAGATGRLVLPETSLLVPSLTALVLLSILWTAWLPTYASFRRAELQGRKVRVRGRERYAVSLICLEEIQHYKLPAWLVRMFTASLITLSWHRPSMDYLSLRSRPASIGSRIFFSLASCIELFILVYSFLTLRLHRPPAVRLIDTSASRASTPGTGTASRTSSPPLLSSTISTSTSTSSHPPELLDGLSLSTTAQTMPLRTWNAAGPVFGYPSLLRPAIFSPAPSQQTRDDADMRSQQQQDEEEDDAMDWTPTASPVRPSSGPIPRGGGGHAQTNGATAADATTGLETLLERTNIDTSEPGGGASYGTRTGRRRTQTTRWSWGWVYALSLVPLIGVVYYQVLLGRGFFAFS